LTSATAGPLRARGELKRNGATTKVGATVSYVAGLKRATLDPNSNLAAGATYIATVTTGAQDLVVQDRAVESPAR
jgi:hypothetical protein